MRDRLSGKGAHESFLATSSKLLVPDLGVSRVASVEGTVYRRHNLGHAKLRRQASSADSRPRRDMHLRGSTCYLLGVGRCVLDVKARSNVEDGTKSPLKLESYMGIQIMSLRCT